MKFRNLLLTAALFLSAGAAFAGNETVPYEKLSWEKSDTFNVSLLMMNSSWDGDNFRLAAYSSTGKMLGNAISFSSFQVTPLNKEQLADMLDQTSLDKTAKDNIKNFNSTHPAYSFTATLSSFEIPEGETVASFGLLGSNNEKTFAYSYLGTDVKGNTEGKGNQLHFSTVGTDHNVLAFADNQWTGSGKFNNGDILLVGLTVPEKEIISGSPLPAPIVTLLIALAFGGAFVMYRNRKQARA